MSFLRFLVERGPQDLILAGEEALLYSVASGSPPLLRFVIFDPTSVLLGYHQSVDFEVDLEELRKREWTLGRRPTGGGAIVMGTGQLGWEIYADSSILGGSIESAMRAGAEGVIETLRQMGLDPSFRPKNDVEIKGRKISGIGAFSEGKYISVTGTILVDFDVESMVSVLKLSPEKMRDKTVTSFRERITWLNRELGRKMDMEDVIRAARLGFSKALGVELRDSPYTEEERMEIGTLRLKYSSPDWIMGDRRAIGGAKVKEKKFPGGLVRVQAKVLGDIVESVLMTGDFFVEPRTAVYNLEARLKWTKRDQVRKEVEEWFKEVKVVGIDPHEFASFMEEVVTS